MMQYPRFELGQETHDLRHSMLLGAEQKVLNDIVVGLPEALLNHPAAQRGTPLRRLAATELSIYRQSANGIWRGFSGITRRMGVKLNAGEVGLSISNSRNRYTDQFESLLVIESDFNVVLPLDYTSVHLNKTLCQLVSALGDTSGLMGFWEMHGLDGISMEADEFLDAVRSIDTELSVQDEQVEELIWGFYSIETLAYSFSDLDVPTLGELIDTIESYRSLGDNFSVPESFSISDAWRSMGFPVEGDTAALLAWLDSTDKPVLLQIIEGWGDRHAWHGSSMLGFECSQNLMQRSYEGYMGTGDEHHGVVGDYLCASDAYDPTAVGEAIAVMTAARTLLSTLQEHLSTQ
ncbi:hypothetical protein A3709_20505 [Halioglobus sp. HI00S01]|uniref:hypothetical protein n=1 Tax=Halioglobus sp. HI00S01 TaxID=1822214 RepID=UPI0007C31A8E|nr:hypothetical protein [Halioglobus sp. HI00S01]KZX57995.1 hypothetical protein A3709_20505 [Halioglobus sp. HI00S01]